MSAPAQLAAFERPALDAVIAAAAAGRAALVDHQLDGTAFASDDHVAGLAAGRPDGWLCTADASFPAFPGRSLELVDPGLPCDHRAPVVSRLLHLQRSSDLRWLTNAFYDSLEQAWPVSEPWSERDTSMLVASPGAVSTAHSDRHHNLLVELTGTKQVMLLEPGAAGHAQALVRSLPSLNVLERPAVAREITLSAGQALYVPPFTIHWVTSTDRTVALTCGWRTPATERMGVAYAAYATMRPAGVRPRTPGGSIDTAVILAARAVRGARDVRDRITRRAGQRVSVSPR